VRHALPHGARTRQTGLGPRTSKTPGRPALLLTHLSLALDRGTHNVAERESSYEPKENVLLKENTG
jgi:hypothetical protein